MDFKDALKWNKRMAAVYAVGIWSVLGSYAYYRLTGSSEEWIGKKEEVQQPENTNQVVHLTDHSKTVIVYQKDFVPYTVRISNFFTSFSSQPGSGDK